VRIKLNQIYIERIFCLVSAHLYCVAHSPVKSSSQAASERVNALLHAIHTASSRRRVLSPSDWATRGTSMCPAVISNRRYNCRTIRTAKSSMADHCLSHVREFVHGL